MSKYDDLLERNPYDTLLDARRTELRTSVSGALDSNPDDVARTVSLAQTSGIPLPVVERNREAVDSQVRLNRYDALLEQSPELAGFLSQRENALVAHDDIASLSGLEWATKAFGAAHAEQWKVVELGTLRARQLTRDLTPEEEARVTQLKKEITGGDFGAETWYEKIVTETGRVLPTMEHAVIQGSDEALAGVITGGAMAAAAGQMGPQVVLPEEVVTVPAGALIGAKVGMTVGATKAVFELEAGLALDEFLDLRDDQGNPLDLGIARGAASMVGIVNAGLELVGLGAVLKRVPGVKNLIPGIGRKAVAEALKKATFRQAIQRFAAGYAASVGAEVTTEVLQEATTILGAEIAGQIAPGEFQGLSAEQIAERLAQIAIKTTQGMAVIGGVGPSMTLVADAQRAIVADRNQTVFEALGQHATDSKLRQRLPAKFQEYVARLREGGEIDSIRIPVDAFAEYFQTQGLDPAEVAREVTGSDAAYTEANAAGTDLVIPLEAYAARLAPTEHHAALMQDLRLRPDEMTAREAQQWREAAESLTSELAGMATPTVRARPVFDDVLGQLLSSGIERSAAEQNAQLMASVFETLGARTGRDPVELYEQYGLRIQQETPEILQRLSNVDVNIDPLLDRLRAGQVPTDREVYGESLTEFLRGAGGVQDQGGELAARDAQKAVRGLVKAKGLSLDAAAELAQEAGYIAEGTQDALLEALDRELGGQAVFRPNALNQQLLDLRGALDDLGQFLGQQGVDLSTATNDEIRTLLQEQTVLEQPVFHGSRHSFSRFSVDKIGTGEGNQAFGWGIYFAENPDVARTYTTAGQAAYQNNRVAELVYRAFDATGNDKAAKEWLFNRAKESPPEYRQIYYDAMNNYDVVKDAGNLYEVEIPDEAVERMLDWDKNMPEQSPSVRAALEKLDVPMFKTWQSNGAWPHVSGQGIYRYLAGGLTVGAAAAGKHRQASLALSAAGIPGIKFLDNFSRSAGKGSRNLVVFDDSIIEIKSVNGKPVTAEQRTELLQTFEETRRGSITFGANRKFTINLLANRDLSTFLHESGHLYLEVLGDLAEAKDAPEQVVQDYAAILKWFGVETRQAIEVKHHEQFARGFEAYLMEGKAPSPELQNAFARFRAWLVQIYRQLAALNVNLTDEVRGVFDRLIATDDAIAAAEEAQNYVALFATAEAAGMSPEEFAAYRKTVERARQQAEDELSRKLLAVMTREQKAWWREEREKVRAEVTAEVHGMRQYRALSFLQHGKNPDGTDVEGVAPVKLSKAILMDEFGYPAEFLKRLPGGGRTTVYAVEGGVHPDIVAAMFGYRGTDEMIQELVNARPMKELIAAETQARMLERYPDPLVDGTLADSAIQAVHSTKRAELLAAELRALRRKQSEVRPFVRAAEQTAAREQRQAREANRAQMPNRDELKLIRAAAERTIARKRVRDIQPAGYRVAEAKAARAAFAAAEKGDFERAYFEKRKQLLNHELFVAAEAAIEESEAIRKYFKRFGKKAVRERLGKAQNGALEKIEALLADFSLQRVTNAKLDQVARKQQVLAMIYEGELLAEPETIRLLEQQTVKNWRELSFEALSGLRDVVKQLEHQASELSHAIVNGERVEIAKAAQGVADSVRATNKVVAITVGTRGPQDAVKRGAKQALLAWLRPAEIARQLDGGVDFGATLRTIIEPIRRAYAEKLLPMERKIREDVAGLYRAAYTNEELKGLTKRISVPALGLSMTRGDLVSLALNWGNEGNRQAVLDSTFNGRKLYSAEGVAAALAQLTAKDWAFVQSVWDYIDTYWADLAALEKRRRGVAPKKVEAAPFDVVTATGERLQVRGGYYPLKYDAALSALQHADDVETEFKKLTQGRYTSANTRAGATIERVGSGGRPVRLGLAVIDQHLHEIARDIALGDETRFVMRVLDRAELRAAMVETGNIDALDTLKLWLQDAAVGEMAARGFLSKASAYTRIGFTKAKLAWNITTTLLQITGLPQTAVVVGPKAFAHGFGRYMANPVRAHKQVMALSAFMRSRYQTNSWNKDVADTRAYLEQHFVVPTQAARAINALSYSFFWPIARVQMLVDGITWMSGYWKGVNERGLSDADAVTYADSTVENAQTSGFFVDRSAIERGTLDAIQQRQSQFVKLWTTLISYMLAKGNIAYAKTKAFSRKPSLWGATTLATDLVLLFAVEAVLAAIIRGQLPDEDDDESIALWLAKEGASSALSGVPFVREIASSKYGSGTTPVGSLATDFYKALVQIEQGEVDPAMLKALNNVGGTLFHYPSSQINKAVDAYWADAVEGEDIAPYEYLTGPRKD